MGIDDFLAKEGTADFRKGRIAHLDMHVIDYYWGPSETHEPYSVIGFLIGGTYCIISGDRHVEVADGMHLVARLNSLGKESVVMVYGDYDEKKKTFDVRELAVDMYCLDEDRHLLYMDMVGKLSYETVPRKRPGRFD